MATHQPPYQDWTVMQEARSIVHYVEELPLECRELTYPDYLLLHLSPKGKINRATNGAYKIDTFCSKKFLDETTALEHAGKLRISPDDTLDDIAAQVRPLGMPLF